MAKQAVGYIRVSTTEQATDGVSLDTQRTRIAAWCEANEYELTALHADAGLSGKRADNRPGLQAALADASKRKGALIVYSLSRLARSIQDAIAISGRLSKAGADLVSLTEKIDTTSASGRLFFHLFSALGQFESELIGERTSAAMRHKQALGEYIGGAAPYGYRLADDGALVADEVEQRTIGLVVAHRAAGWSLRKIAAALDTASIRPRRGERWHPQTVARIVAATQTVETRTAA